MKGLLTIALLLAAWLPGGASAAAEAATTERQYGGIFLERFVHTEGSIAKCTDVYLNPAYIVEVRPSPWPVTDATKFGTWGADCERSATVEGIALRIILSHGSDRNAEYLYNGTLNEFRLELWDAHP